MMVLVALALLSVRPAPPGPGAASAVRVEFDAGEADAVLAILRKRASAEPSAAEDWERLFASDGYRRLEAREAAMKRPFTGEEFRKFVESPELAARSSELAATLTAWKTADVEAAARRALAYLPAGTRIRAKVFPEIKPRPNSFVFSEPDPAIFLALDPSVSSAKMENTLAHELHHIGIAAACAAPPEADLTPRAQAIRWLSAFGEGLAMLAASGGPETHPHAVSPPEDRARWDRDMLGFDRDLATLDAFFRDIVRGTLSREKADERGFSFFGVQGPWYTVGYRMAVSIEKTFGRAEVIRVFCDPRLLPAAFNRAADRAGDSGARWSAAVVEALSKPR